jgi:hypothetical protein
MSGHLAFARWGDMSTSERDEPYPRLPEDPGADDDLSPDPREDDDGQLDTGRQPPPDAEPGGEDEPPPNERDD